MSAAETETELEKTVDNLRVAVEGLSSKLVEERPVESAVKWATPWKNLVALIAFFVVGGISVMAAFNGYARGVVVETAKEAHSGKDPQVEPSVKTVEALKTDVASVKSGVDCLVQSKRHEDLIKSVEVELQLHRQQYADAMQEWSAKSAARRNPGEKPTKSDGHLNLEATLKKLTGSRPSCPTEQ